MRVAHMVRKPLSEGTVAKNVLKHGTGAININATRIHSGPSEGGDSSGANAFGQDAGWNKTDVYVNGIDRSMPKGRWPANVILQHRPGCQDESCVSDCPVADLDAQSGVRPSTWTHSKDHKPSEARPTSKFRPNQGEYMPQGPLYADNGGASRFYKQVHGTMETNGIPQELLDYLHKLITPIHIGGECFEAMDLVEVDWTCIPDESFHAAIIMGDPTPYLDELWRILKPGSHITAISPEDEPTGHTGACALEDRGFEIRDAILWVQEPGRLHYVAKPSPSERHAGCEKLKIRRNERAEAERDDDDDELMEQPEAPIELNLHKGNVHPTCKPKAIMTRLLGDVPIDALVLDPFMGSGTTGLACLDTGHDFVGIEKDPDYIEIADTRIHHWDSAVAGWNGATIESEAPKHVEKAEEVDFFDFME